VEIDKNDFGNSVYGLINFRLILIRNYIFSSFDKFAFFFGNSTAIFSIQKEQWEGSTAIFPYSEAM